MSFNTLHVIAATSVVTALVLLQVCDVSGLSCHSCPPNQECPTLPDDCEQTRRGCGCCFVCKAKLGAACSASGLTCKSGLMCVNQNGVALSVVKWHHFGFEGKCQKVDMCQVLTRSWYDIDSESRRNSGPFKLLTAKMNVVHLQDATDADEEAGIADEEVAIPV